MSNSDVPKKQLTINYSDKLPKSLDCKFGSHKWKHYKLHGTAFYVACSSYRNCA